MKTIKDSISFVIVDDEFLAREELKYMLTQFPKMKLSGEAQDVDSAILLIKKIEPDIIFLDIEMPLKSGFDLLDSLTFSPKIIFTTAYNQFAIEAFERHAVDYLLKPICLNRLQKTYEKILNLFPELEFQERKIENSLDKIFIKDGNKCYFISFNEIHYVKSVGNYSKIYFNNQSVLIHKSLNKLEKRFNNQLFFRANRQEIINLDYVENIEFMLKNNLIVSLKSGRSIEISSRQSLIFKSLLTV